MAVGSTRSVMVSGERACGSGCQALKITRLVREETKDLIKTYVSAQKPSSSPPEPRVSGSFSQTCGSADSKI